MKTGRVSLFGLFFGILVAGTFVAACSSPSGSTPGTGGNNASGQGGTGGSISCGPDEALCGTQCLNTTADSSNCGGCGIPCLGGHTCQASQCKCAAGLLECNGSCVASDATHCGSCTNACPSGQVCNGGNCSSTCTSTQTPCGTACCESNQTCTNNACVDNSGPGTAGTSGGAGSSGSAGTTGSAGSSGTAGRGGTTGTAGSVGGAGRGGTTGMAGTTGTGGMAATPKLITSAPNAYWTINGTLTTSTGTATVTVNDSTSTSKTWEGFGGAFNEAGWSYLQMLSATDRDKAMKLLFDGTDGAHFVMGRIPIGASDYALTRYTEDETANDTSLTGFGTTRDTMYLIPYVKAAQAINGSIRFWASPWTPPTWMKTNTGTVNGTSCARVGSTAYDGGCMQDIAANLTALAQYFVKWIQAYNAQGIIIDTLAAQNEPNYAQGYPSALWTPALYTKFIGQYLGPALSGMSTKIMLGTMSNGDNGTSSKDLMVVQAVMADATAKGLVKNMGLQWGMLDLYRTNQSSFNTGSLPVWATEHKCGNYPWNPGGGLPAYKEPAPNDQAYGVESWGYIRDAITKAGVSAYNAWNMVLDTVGKGNDTARQWSQDALLIVNTSSKTLTPSPAYYVFRHVSQYVQVGAKVVTTTGGDAIAFKNPDGSFVVAMYNSGGASTYVVQAKNQKLQFAMPATGWATVVVP
jgi:glucosylceramidase